MNMTVNDIPLISFFQRVLDPLVIMGLLYLLAFASGSPFTGYMLVLMILAIFISSTVFQHVDPYRTWRSGRMLAYARDILIGWGITALILVFLGSATGLAYHFDTEVVLAWLILTPFVLLACHLAARKFSLRPDGESEVRSVVIIGANDASLKFAATIARNPNLFMSVHGFFDDRTDDRWPEKMREPMLGRMNDIAAYVREHHIKMIFISQPISAQPRIRKMLDDLEDTTASVYFLPDIYIFDLMQARFDNVGGMPVIAIRESPFTGYNSMIKRGSDIVLGLLIQILLLPLMLLIAIAVKLTLERPGDFPPAPLRPVRRRDRGLQVPLDDGGRGWRQGGAGHQERPAGDPGRRFPAPQLARRIAAVFQRPAGAHEHRRAAPACGGA